MREHLSVIEAGLLQEVDAGVPTTEATPEGGQ
jgi:hypothetical protein